MWLVSLTCVIELFILNKTTGYRAFAKLETAVTQRCIPRGIVYCSGSGARSAWSVGRRMYHPALRRGHVQVHTALSFWFGLNIVPPRTAAV